MIPVRLQSHLICFAVCLLFIVSCSSSEKVSPAQQGQPQEPDWQVVGPGGGGSTFFFPLSSLDPHRIAIRCDMTGIYLTDNGGKSWKIHNLTSTASCFAFESESKDVVYAGTAGFYRTEDFGKSWELIFPVPDDTLGRKYSAITPI